MTTLIPQEHDRLRMLVSINVKDQCLISDQEINFDLGHAEDFGVVKLLDSLCSDMRIGEIKNYSASIKEALSKSESTILTPNQNLDDPISFNVKILDIQKLKNVWELGENDKFQVATVMKRRGNKLFSADKFTRALKAYKIAINLLKGSSIVKPGLTDSVSSESSEAKKLLLNSYSNAALTLLTLSRNNPQERIKKKSNNFAEKSELLLCSIKLAEKGIEIDAKNTKLWFNMAKAYAELSDFEEAVRFGQKALDTVQYDQADEKSTVLKKQIDANIVHWRNLSIQALKEEHQSVRASFCRRIHEMIAKNDFYCDDIDELDMEINPWANSLADGMMSLHEELEAFGEKMPERSLSKLIGNGEGGGFSSGQRTMRPGVYRRRDQLNDSIDAADSDFDD